MALGLHNLQVSKNSTKRRKRVGRGNASGKGTYSGRGIKGQRSRSGGKSGLVMKGVKAYIFKIPKNRGFKSLKVPVVAITLETLESVFENGEIITPKKLKQAGILKSSAKAYKILQKGDLTKKFTVKAHAFSDGARAAIEKVGGKAEELENIITKELKTQRTREQKGS